jgi:hypothetical protein
MYFGGTAARASAIPTPTTGMTSYIGVTGTATIPQLETYTGSQWQTPYGLTQVANVSFTAASTISIDNVFSARYDNYIVQLNLMNNVNNNVDNTLRMRAGGVDNNSGVYYTAMQGYFGSRNDVTDFTTAFAFMCSTGAIGTRSNYQINVARPFTTDTHKQLTTIGAVFNSSVSTIVRNIAGYIVSSTQFDGFTMIAGSGTLTGTARVYGYRNS